MKTYLQQYVIAIMARTEEKQRENSLGDNTYRDGYVDGLRNAIRIIETVYRKKQRELEAGK